MGVPGRERPTAGREWGKTVMHCNRLADQRARKGRFALADGRPWPASLIGLWLKCLHDKHKARKLGKKARECKSISKECTTFAMPKTK